MTGAHCIVGYITEHVVSLLNGPFIVRNVTNDNISQPEFLTETGAPTEISQGLYRGIFEIENSPFLKHALLFPREMDRNSKRKNLVDWVGAAKIVLLLSLQIKAACCT